MIKAQRRRRRTVEGSPLPLPLIMLLCTIATIVCAESSPNSSYQPQLATPPKQLFVDVDNCLYRESQLSKGIEAQIVRGIHSYCQQTCGLTGAQTDDLFAKFGSTEEGLRRTLWKNATASQLRKHLQDYYDTVYGTVDVSGLFPSSTTGSDGSTGYSHATREQQATLRKLLGSSMSPSITLASNSPLVHVRKVLQAMGLCNVVDSRCDILTPDQRAKSGTGSNKVKEPLFPTKASPKDYFGTLLQHHGKSHTVMVDDSTTNLQTVQSYMKGYHVADDQPLLEALCRTAGWLDEAYTFDAVAYLRAKNIMDTASLDRQTYNKMVTCLVQELSLRAKAKDQSSSLQIVDVGAGLLSMHKLLLGQNTTEDDMPSFLSILRDKKLSIKDIHYVAYEPNEQLRIPCVAYLLDQGYHLVHEYAWDDENNKDHVQEMVFERSVEGEATTICVSLRFWDFRRNIATSTDDQALSPDLIVGCCFADLLDPNDLTESILRCFLNTPNDHQTTALLYFPITFRGATQFVPASPASFKEDDNRWIPSDTQAFAMYSKILKDVFGHSLDPSDLIDSMNHHGGQLIARGSSDWKIDIHKHEYLWRTMMYFFATSAAPEMQSLGYNAGGWIKRSWENRPMIHASNCDLLFQLPYIGRWESFAQANDLAKLSSTEFLQIQFSSPKKVAFVSKQRPKLKPGEIRLKSLCSLISSGTELKIFTGSFDDAALDVNIKSMEGQRMGYPLSYGYSLVGRVIECGESVETDMIGRNVFTFSPHASEVVTQADSVQLIPEGVDPMDAIFMPSVETALSIVHDAQTRLGENIVVLGQGLIGLLVTALLSKTTVDLKGPSLTTVDTLADRLASSALLGSQQAIFPGDIASCGQFDVAVEASGNYRALQSALDCTRNGGRVIIASWYGSEPAMLKLGLNFHRSHKTIRTSQVSELPAELRETWTKQRRFDLAWEILKDLRPSRLLTKIASPNEAKEAYDELFQGSQLAVAFDYTMAKQ